MAEKVPPSVNNMDVLMEYFGQFGPVSALQVNHNRHEAIVTFAHLEDAREALRFPVLNDPSVGLRPWRSSRFGHGSPDSFPSFEASVQPKAVASSALATASASADASQPSSQVTPGFAERPKASSNMMLESATIVEKKKQKEGLEDRRLALLQGLTNQLKAVMAKISDPKTSEKNRETLQAILATIKEKITALTPQPQEFLSRLRLAPPSRSLTNIPTQPLPNAFRRPAALRLSNLPAELQGPDAEVRLGQALGDGLEAVLSWSENGSSCVVRFSERRFAEVARQAQKVWGFTAEWCSEEAEPYTGTRLTAAALSAGAENPEEHIPGSPETEAMDSDIADDEVIGAMAAAGGISVEELQEAVKADRPLAARDAYSVPEELAEEPALQAEPVLQASEAPAKQNEETEVANEEAVEWDPASV